MRGAVSSTRSAMFNTMSDRFNKQKPLKILTNFLFGKQLLVICAVLLVCFYFVELLLGIPELLPRLVNLAVMKDCK